MEGDREILCCRKGASVWMKAYEATGYCVSAVKLFIYAPS